MFFSRKKKRFFIIYFKNTGLLWHRKRDIMFQLSRFIGYKTSFMPSYSDIDIIAEFKWKENEVNGMTDFIKSIYPECEIKEFN